MDVVPESLRDFAPYRTFEAAAGAVVEALQRAVGLRDWVVARAEGEHWRVWRAHGETAPPVGEILPDAGRFSTSARCATAPLVTRAGEVFGVLYGCDPVERHAPDGPADLGGVRDLIRACARALSTILTLELEADALQRRAERAEAEALLDPLTGLYNRRGWDRLLLAEEERSIRYGHPATIFIIDLDQLKEVNDTAGHSEGDELLRRTARTLRSVARETDVVARLGGDEFGILAVETNAKAGAALAARIERALAEAEIDASVGAAQRRHLAGLHAAWEEADAAMYAQKRGEPLEEGRITSA